MLCKSTCTIQHVSTCMSLRAQGLLQPGRHLPSPQAAGPSPAQSSRDAEPPSAGCLVACVKQVGLVQVLAGRYPCVSDPLPVRRRLGGCQARAGWGPLRSAGRNMGTCLMLGCCAPSLAPCSEIATALHPFLSDAVFPLHPFLMLTRPMRHQHAL